ATWRLKHKLMQAMKEFDDKQSLEFIVQLDDAYWGGKSKGGKRGRGAAKKVPFIAAVEVNEERHPIYMRMSVVESFKKNEVKQWASKHIAPKTLVITDGLGGFDGLTKAGIYHDENV
ncbi:IS1595 family transposase, partial [Vibrio alfacsensis]|uniref:IS1595 family transposase n=1 Tax=Vibrio alfacsensis TaxID=1074311 RepID=UPI00406859E0